MVEVAQAGAGSEEISSDGKFCERTAAERMPMLFLFPDLMGGFSMLGLGDIFLPGLFVSYCLRLDYLKMKISQRCEREEYTLYEFIAGHQYYAVACLAYSIGLFLTILANYYDITINRVEGQPALLYLVPVLLGSVAALARFKRDLKLLWLLSLPEIEKASLSPANLQDIECDVNG